MAEEKKGVRASKMTAPRPRRMKHPSSGAGVPASFVNPGTSVLDNFLEVFNNTLHGGGSATLDALKDVILSLTYVGKDLEASNAEQMDEIFGTIRDHLRQFSMNPYVEMLLLGLIERRAMNWAPDASTLAYYEKKDQILKVKQSTNQCQINLKKLPSKSPRSGTVDVTSHICDKDGNGVRKSTVMQGDHKRSGASSQASVPVITVEHADRGGGDCQVDEKETAALFRDIVCHKQLNAAGGASSNASLCSASSYRTCRSNADRKRPISHIDTPTSMTSNEMKKVHADRPFARTFAVTRRPRSLRFPGAGNRLEAGDRRQRSCDRRRSRSLPRHGSSQPVRNGHDNERKICDDIERIPIGADASYQVRTGEHSKLRMDREFEKQSGSTQKEERLLLRFPAAESKALTKKMLGFIAMTSETLIREMTKAGIGMGKSEETVIEIFGSMRGNMKAARLIKEHIKDYCEGNVKYSKPASFKNLIPTSPVEESLNQVERSRAKGMGGKKQTRSPDAGTLSDTSSRSAAKGSRDRAWSPESDMVSDLTSEEGSVEREVSRLYTKTTRLTEAQEKSSAPSANKNPSSFSTRVTNKRPPSRYRDLDRPGPTSRRPVLTSWLDGVGQLQGRRKSDDEIGSSAPRSVPDAIQRCRSASPTLMATTESSGYNFSKSVSATVPEFNFSLTVPTFSQVVSAPTSPKKSYSAAVCAKQRPKKKPYGLSRSAPQFVVISKQKGQKATFNISESAKEVAHKVIETGQSVSEKKGPDRTTQKPRTPGESECPREAIRVIPKSEGVKTESSERENGAARTNGAVPYSCVVDIKGKSLKLESNCLDTVQYAKKVLDDLSKRATVPSDQVHCMLIPKIERCSQQVQVNLEDKTSMVTSSVQTQTDDIEDAPLCIPALADVARPTLTKLVKPVSDGVGEGSVLEKASTGDCASQSPETQPVVDDFIFSEEDDKVLVDEWEKVFQRAEAQSREGVPSGKPPAYPKPFQVSTANRFTALGSHGDSPDVPRVTSTPVSAGEVVAHTNPGILREARLQLGDKYRDSGPSGSSVLEGGAISAAAGDANSCTALDAIRREYSPNNLQCDLRWPPSAEKRVTRRKQSESLCSLSSDMDLEGLVRNKMEESYQSVASSATSYSAQSTRTDDVSVRCLSPTDTESISSLDSVTLSQPAGSSKVHVVRQPISANTAHQGQNEATRGQARRPCSADGRRRQFMQTNLQRRFGETIRNQPSKSGEFRYGRQFLLACARSPLARKPLNEWEHIAKLLPEICFTEVSRYFNPLDYSSPKRGAVHFTSREVTREASRERPRSRSRSRQRADDGMWRTSQKSNNSSCGRTILPPVSWNWRGRAEKGHVGEGESTCSGSSGPSLRPGWSFK